MEKIRAICPGIIYPGDNFDLSRQTVYYNCYYTDFEQLVKGLFCPNLVDENFEVIYLRLIKMENRHKIRNNLGVLCLLLYQKK